MAKPTTIRIPEDLLKEIDKVVKELQLDRSAYLREVLRKGLRSTSIQNLSRLKNGKNNDNISRG